MSFTVRHKDSTSNFCEFESAEALYEYIASSNACDIRDYIFEKNGVPFNLTDVAPISKKKHGHPRFYELLESLAKLHSAKNHDYAGDDPLSNFRMCEEMGLPAWKGVVVRLTDKWARLLNFTKKEELLVKDESFIDTLRDNAIYSLLCIILFEERDQNDNT
jgi:hypothetical protein